MHAEGIPLPPVTVQVHRALSISHGARYREHIPRHQHLDHELLLIDAGTYFAEIDGVRIEAPAGSLVVVMPGQWHVDELRGPLKYRAICCTCQATESGPSARLVRRGISVNPILAKPVANDDEVRQSFDACHRAWRSGQTLGPAIAQAAALQLIWQLAQRLPADQRGSAYQLHDHNDVFRSQLECCFATHVREQLSTATMAESLGMSERGLRQRCQRQLGTSPGRAFTRYRLQHAADLLRSTDMTVAAVAEHLGYGSPYQFSAAFKRVYGSAPGRYRFG